jgi:hypothetical protein
LRSIQARQMTRSSGSSLIVKTACRVGVTPMRCIAILQYKMQATLIAHTKKEVRDDGAIVEIVIWSLPEPLPPSVHHYTYRLYYGQGGVGRMRYDNERGKDDHRHIDGRELSCRFESIDKLLDDFERDIASWSAP